MPSCKSCCRKCFPSGCCGFCKPPPQVQQQVDIEIHLKKNEEKKKTAYGFIEICSGVRTSENNYTCPMLCVHLYRHSQFKAKILRDKRMITVGENNQQQTDQGPQEAKGKDTFTAEEEIIMLPVEDVIRILSKSEIETGIEADVKSHITPVYEESENCCDRCCAGLASYGPKERKVVPLVLDRTTIVVDEDPNRFTDDKEEDMTIPEKKEGCCTRCCNPFRCWCCRKKKLVRLIKRTKTVAEQEAKRVITITIEYIPYSNLDSASNPHILDSEQKLAVYKDQFKTDKLEFYLVHSKEFDPVKFQPQQEEAEILCRTVMHLKAMRNHYPSENELKVILGPSYKRAFGDKFVEPILQLPFDPKTTRKDPQVRELSQPLPLQSRTTTSEHNEEAE